MSFNFEQEKARIEREQQLLLQQAKIVVQVRPERSSGERKLLLDAYKIAQEAGLEDMLVSAKNSPWNKGEITSGEEGSRKYARLSYRYEIPRVEEGITGSRLRYGTYVTQGIQLGDRINVKQKTGLHREPKHGIISWTTQDASTTLEAGVMLLDGKPHIYVYDNAEDLRDAFHDVHPREVPRYTTKNFLHDEIDPKHFGQALELISETSLDLVRDFLRDHIVASCVRRQQDGNLPRELTLSSQTKIATLPPGKRQ